MSKSPEIKTPTPLPIVVAVTGLSGAGRSTAISSLEDLGFTCIDSLPLEMLSDAITHIRNLAQQDHRYFALGMEVSSVEFIKALQIARVAHKDHLQFDHVHLTCDEEVIRVRYSATRRKHPQAIRGKNLSEAIGWEKSLLSSCVEESDICFDTSHWSPHQLARIIEKRYSTDSIGRNLNVHITSFGFKHGSLQSADALCDVRFLINPYFVPELSDHTGLEENVRKFLESDEVYQEFVSRIFDLYKFLIPHYYNEGKHYFQIGIGCTGGKHRSVAITEELTRRLRALDWKNVVISASHRDIPT